MGICMCNTYGTIKIFESNYFSNEVKRAVTMVLMFSFVGLVLNFGISLSAGRQGKQATAASDALPRSKNRCLSSEKIVVD